MSGEVPLPAIDGVRSFDFDLERNVDVPLSVLGNTVQRNVRSGDRWRGGLSFPPVQDDEAGVLSGWLRQATRGDRWMWLSPPQSRVRGNWAPADLVSNGTFLDGSTTGWTATSSTLSVNARRLKVKNTGAAAGRAAQNITMEVNKPHVVIVDGHRGIAMAAQVTVNRQSDGVAEASSGVVTVPDRIVLLATPTVAAMNLRLLLGTAVSGDDVLFGGVSVTRCLQVNGGSQTGNRLSVDGGPASANAALKVGEFVCFLVGTRYQLVQLTEDFDTDSGGAGVLAFEPLLRGSPADNAAVIVRYPFGRFFIPDHRGPVSVSPPYFHGFAVSVLEDITA